MPSVSIIIPVYNVEPYVERCMRSLFGQTLQDLEYIFVDDCSPDQSTERIRQVLEGYPQRKNQARFFRMPENSGQAKVRMMGISKATGEYVIQCDPDDEVDTDAYRLMYEKAKAENLDIVGCDFKIVGKVRRRIQSQYSKPGREIADILCGKVWGSLVCRMFRRNLLTDLFLPKGDMWEDVVFSVQAISKAARIGYIPKPLYLYYTRQDSITNEKGPQSAVKRWRAMVANTEQIFEYLSHIPPVSLQPSDEITLKYKCRSALNPYVHIPEYYQKWRATFPEVDKKVLWVKNIRFADKLDFVLIRLHLFHPWNSISRFIQNGLTKAYCMVHRAVSNGPVT